MTLLDGEGTVSTGVGGIPWSLVPGLFPGLWSLVPFPSLCFQVLSRVGVCPSPVIGLAQSPVLGPAQGGTHCADWWVP